MAVEREPIFWRGELVGYIVNPTRFPALWRGMWAPAGNGHGNQFLEELRCGRSIWVEFGSGAPTTMARVTAFPEEMIELYLEVEDSPTLMINPFKQNPPNLD